MKKIGKCSRCGIDIDIYDYVQNVKSFVVLKVKVLLRFCDSCVKLISERKDEE